LLTDRYELTMAASYLRRGMVGPATFSLFVRELPADRGFLVAAGLADCLEFLEKFHFTGPELDWLRGEFRWDAAMVERFARLRFTGDVAAVPEGTTVFAGEPLLEVTAPLAEAQLVESYLLNTITLQTTVATKAARCRLAAAGAGVVDFSLRRDHGVDAAMAVARCCALVGFAGTSNVEAARRYGMRSVGTMAHSYVEAFADERSAFRAFAEDFPDNIVFLVDTYDTAGGVRAAIDVMAELGVEAGIRLDSGDLAQWAHRSRRMLDAAGHPGALIVASGGLDEYAIAELVARDAPIDVYGVGTRMGVSADAPYLDTAYKLVAYGQRPVMKLSMGKVGAPGAKQVFRRTEHAGDDTADLLGLREEIAPPGYQPLLLPVMASGRRVRPDEKLGRLSAATLRLEAGLRWLPDRALALRGPTPVPVAFTPGLSALTERVRASLGRA
jgi:nicotinate phosphoribosyltransferase